MQNNNRSNLAKQKLSQSPYMNEFSNNDGRGKSPSMNIMEEAVTKK